MITYIDPLKQKVIDTTNFFYMCSAPAWVALTDKAWRILRIEKATGSSSFPILNWVETSNFLFLPSEAESLTYASIS